MLFWIRSEMPWALLAQDDPSEALGGLLGLGCVCGISVFSLAAMAFWIWMLIDCATKEPAEDPNKVAWLVVVALTSWLGALIYYLVRRPKRIAQYGK